MSWHTLPFTPREHIRATEARLDAIYEAAKLGLQGDSLALAAGLLPQEYRRLAEFDPLVDLAAQKGRADSERALAQTMHAAAADGDTKAALDLLKHQHGWVARQAVDVSVEATISVKHALQMALQRVESLADLSDDPSSGDAGGLIDVTPARPATQERMDADADL